MTNNWVPEETAAPAAASPRLPRPGAWRTWAILVITLLIGVYFRTLNLTSWDGTSYLHPDERFIIFTANGLQVPRSFGDYLASACPTYDGRLNKPRNPQDSPEQQEPTRESGCNTLNPRNYNWSRFFVYGTLPTTLTRVVAELRHTLDAEQIRNTGRMLSTLWDLGSIVMVFLIGRRLYDRRVGLLAALLMAMAVLPIQLAHFFTVDSATAFFTLLTIYWTIRVAQGGSLGSFVGMGLSIGAAMACRATLATLALVAVAAVAQRVWWHQEPRTANRGHGFVASFGMLVLAGVLALLAFRVLQPDAFVGSPPGAPPTPALAQLSPRLRGLDSLFQGRGFFDIRPEPRFIENLKTVQAQVSGEQDFPPAQQWANRVRYLFPLQNMILWGMGLPLGLAAWLAWTIAGWQMLRWRRLVHLLPWLWIAFYFAWQGGIQGMTMRYYMLLYGLLIVFAAWALVALWDRRPTTDHRPPTNENHPEGTRPRTENQEQMTDDRRPELAHPLTRSPARAGLWSVVGGRWSVVAGRLALVLVVLGTLCWAYAFTRIYTRPHSRIAATRWIYNNIPPGAARTFEAWDDPLPLNIDGHNDYEYIGVDMAPYQEDDRNKYFGEIRGDGSYNPGLFDQLDTTDYIVLSSNRVYGSATRLPMRYPALTRYYHYLFSGDLGFELVADIHSYPTLFGIEINDQGAEEAFSVYDHPRVLIFKKTPAYSRARAQDLITGDVSWGEVYKLATGKVSRVPTALRLTEAEWPLYRAGGTWTALFDPASIANKVPWLVWILVLELLSLAMFALLFRLLPGLPDRGFALAKTLGLLVVAYGAWVLGSAHIMAFTPTTVWLCAGVLIALGALAGWTARADLLAFVRRRRAALIAAEGLFLLAFFGFVLIRAINPDLWHGARGGEKPMDLAFLTAVLKSSAFPPYDPWFAGGYINYYYFGFVFVGALIHLTGIVPTTAYNLAVPTVFALTALGAWGVAYNLVALHGPRTKNQGQARVRLRSEWRAITAGIVAAVFVVVVGNLAQAVWLMPGTTKLDDGDLTAEQQSKDPFPNGSYAEQQNARGRNEWAFWDATRIVGLSLHDSTINEFPFFTFLYADLHAHMIALPFAAAALGLLVALVRTENHPEGTRPGTRRQRWRRIGSRFLVLGSLALIVGALRATNTWDYPTYMGLSVLTLALLAWNEWRHGSGWLAALGDWVLARIGWQRGVGLAALAGWALASLGLLLLSSLLFLPFTSHFATDYAGLELWKGSRTLASDFLKINGLWLYLLLSAALVLYYRARGIRPQWLALIGVALAGLTIVALRLDPKILNTDPIPEAGFQGKAIVLLIPLVVGAIWFVFDLLIGTRPAIASRAPAGDPPPQQSMPQPEEPVYTQLALPEMDEIVEPPAPVLPPAPRGPVTAARLSLATLLPVIWAMCALGITLVTEVIVAKGDIGRMNTVFKFGMQSWVLFGICSALALTWLLGLIAAPSNRPTLTAYKALGLVWSIPAALLIAGALAYPLTATPARLADRFDTDIPPTLDGTAYMRSPQSTWSENDQNINFSEDANAMDWMRQNIPGTPIVLEAHAEAYRWSGRVSIYTGLPTLLGWPWHETQQRSVAEVGPILSNRQGLVQNLYSAQSPVEALQQLRLYGVEYVYVGQLERALYDPAGLAKFDLLAREGNIQQVYASGATRIYHIPSADHLPAVLTTSLPVQAPEVSPTKTLLLDTPVAELPLVDEYAWNRLADSQPVAVILWLLASYVLLALGLPLAGLAFGRGRPGAWSDGGYAWARLIGLLLLGYAIWMPVSMRLWLYNRWGLLFGLLLVLTLDAALLILRGRGLRHADRLALGGWLVNGLRALWADLKTHWRRILLLEALFLATFAFMTVLRMLNPDLWQPYYGGEKPFEFGMLNAILRSPVMPPYDPFYSDGILNYYYYGLFLVSLPVKATGIAPAVAFNLIIPTLFAITVVSAFGLVARMTGRVRFGLAGAAFVALLGNLAAAFAVGGSPGLKPVQDALRDGGLSELGERLGAWFWGPSRVIPNTINEFPYWSFLFADLHAHLIALPITILVAALAYEFLTSRRPTTDDRRPTTDDQNSFTRSPVHPFTRSSSWSVVSGQWSVVGGRWLLAALALGALAVTNSWDFPTYALLIAGVLLGRAWRARARSIGERIIGVGTAVITTGLLCASALLLYLPFFENYLALVQGIDRVRDRTPIVSYTLIYGLFLAVLIPLLLGAAWRLLGRLPARGRALDAGPLADDIEATPVVGIVANQPSRQRLAISPRLIMVIVLGLLAVVALWQPRLSLDIALVTCILVGASILLARRPSPTTWFITWMAVVAWAVSFGIEHIYIRDHLAGGDWYRMNTVFKFGMQAWVLLALAAAAGLPVLMRGLRRLSLIAEGVAWPILGGLLAVALVFPLVGTPSRLATRFPETVGPTLDGLAFMDKATFTAEYLGNAPIDLRGDGEAIRWLNANVPGTPVVLQSSMEFYRTYGNRVAANTGLPTIMGSQHESEQRDGGPVGLRDNEVQQIYRTLDPSEALRLLAKYRVNYLYVGPIERAAYGEPGAAKFDQMDGSYLNLVYRNPTVKIFKVNESVYSIIGAAPPRPAPQPPAGLSQPQPIIVQPAPNPPPNQTAPGDLVQQVADNPTAAGPAFELAQRYRDAGRLDDAANVLAAAAPANPTDVALHQLWGDILRDAGRRDEAEAAYRAAIAASPKAGNYNKLGIELLNWRMIEKAEEVFQQAISVDPNQPEPYYHLGQIYEQQGKPDQAIEAYTQYLNLAAPDGPYRNQATSALSRLGR